MRLPLSPFKSWLYKKSKHISWGAGEGETMKMSILYNNPRWMTAKGEEADGIGSKSDQILGDRPGNRKMFLNSRLAEWWGDWICQVHSLAPSKAHGFCKERLEDFYLVPFGLFFSLPSYGLGSLTSCKCCGPSHIMEFRNVSVSWTPLSEQPCWEALSFEICRWSSGVLCAALIDRQGGVAWWDGWLFLFQNTCNHCPVRKCELTRPAPLWKTAFLLSANIMSAGSFKSEVNGPSLSNHLFFLKRGKLLNLNTV